MALEPIKIPTPEEVIQTRAATNLSASDFGKLLGYHADPARVVRALEHGERHGKPYRMAPSAAAAMTYALALAAVLDASDDPRAMERALRQVAVLIPKRMLK